MRGKVIQTLSALSAEYDIYKSNAKVANAVIKQNINLASIKVIDDYGNSYLMKHEPFIGLKNIKVKKEMKEYEKYFLYDMSGQKILSICSKKTKGFFGYSYYSISKENNELFVYVVGMGKSGIKIIFEMNEKQIALIEKSPEVINNLDEYEIYAIDELSFKIASIFSLYYDLSVYSNSGEIAKASKTVNYVKTTNKTLVSKYNPDFKINT